MYLLQFSMPRLRLVIIFEYSKKQLEALARVRPVGSIKPEQSCFPPTLHEENLPPGMAECLRGAYFVSQKLD